MRIESPISTTFGRSALAPAGGWAWAARARVRTAARQSVWRESIFVSGGPRREREARERDPQLLSWVYTPEAGSPCRPRPVFGVSASADSYDDHRAEYNNEIERQDR